MHSVTAATMLPVPIPKAFDHDLDSSDAGAGKNAWCVSACFEAAIMTQIMTAMMTVDHQHDTIRDAFNVIQQM